MQKGQEPGSIVDLGLDEDVRRTRNSGWPREWVGEDPHEAPSFSSPFPTPAGGPLHHPQGFRPPRGTTAPVP